MKKIISIALVLVLALGVFAGCGAKTELEGTTSEIIDKIIEDSGIAETTPMTSTNEISAEDPADFTGLTADFYKENIESGSVSEPMMGSFAHSIVLLKVKEGVSAEEVATMVFEKVNMRKWICVNADNMYVNTSEDYVFMIMSTAELVDAVSPVFETLAGDVGEAQTKTFG